MVMPQPFTTQSPRLVTFNYTDIASGTGYENYYLMAVEDATAETYALTSQTLYSDEEYLSFTRTDSGESVFTKDIDKDFDLPEFKFSRTVEGTLNINIPYVYNTDNGTNPAEWYIAIKLRKWDGSTETEIASNDSKHFTALTTGGVAGVFSFSVTVPKTYFAQGEQLRITLEAYTKFTGSANGIDAALGIDPANRAATYESIEFDTTQSLIQIPYNLE